MSTRQQDVITPSLDHSKPFSLDELAMALDIKKGMRSSKKSPYPLQAFVCDYSEREALEEIIYACCEHASVFEAKLSFQVAFLDAEKSGRRHWSLFAFEFSSFEGARRLKILSLDSLGPQMAYNQVQILARGLDIEGLTEEDISLKVQLYIPDLKVQHSKMGCAMFTFDWLTMLSNQNQYVNVFTFMEAHPVSGADYVGLKEDYPVVCAKLPSRLLRVAQNRSIFLNEGLGEETALVNSKGQTVSQSIASHCRTVFSPDSEAKMVNDRILHKALHYRSLIDKQEKTSFTQTSRMDALQPFIEEQMHKHLQNPSSL